MQGEEQQGIGHHKEEHDPVPASSPRNRDEKGSNPGGESIWGKCPLEEMVYLRLYFYDMQHDIHLRIMWEGCLCVRG